MLTAGSDTCASCQTGPDRSGGDDDATKRQTSRPRANKPPVDHSGADRSLTHSGPAKGDEIAIKVKLVPAQARASPGSCLQSATGQARQMSIAMRPIRADARRPLCLRARSTTHKWIGWSLFANYPTCSQIGNQFALISRPPIVSCSARPTSGSEELTGDISSAQIFALQCCRNRSLRVPF